jgi:hypothetical protein
VALRLKKFGDPRLRRLSGEAKWKREQVIHDSHWLPYLRASSLHNTAFTGSLSQRVTHEEHEQSNPH